MRVKEEKCEKRVVRDLGLLKEFLVHEVEAAGKKGLVVGVSGGVDSAACLYLAAAALGKEKIRAIYMPHKGGFVNPHVSLMCGNLGVDLKIYDLSRIATIFSDMTGERDPLLKGNFAARLRSAFLYQEAASLDMLVLNTSNRSEIMTGYFTKWGDQAGDISPFGNYYKSEVQEIAILLGVPEEIVAKAPSPDFFEGQRDEEELGISYRDLDRVLAVLDGNCECKIEDKKHSKVKELFERSLHKRNAPLTAKKPG